MIPIKISKRKRVAIEKAILRINETFSKAHYLMNTLQQELRDIGMDSVVLEYHSGDELCFQDEDDSTHGLPEDFFTLDEIVEHFNKKDNG